MMTHARYTAKLAEDVAQSLLDMKAEELARGMGKQDVLSLLGKDSMNHSNLLLIHLLK